MSFVGFALRSPHSWVNTQTKCTLLPGCPPPPPTNQARTSGLRNGEIWVQIPTNLIGWPWAGHSFSTFLNVYLLNFYFIFIYLMQAGWLKQAVLFCIKGGFVTCICVSWEPNLNAFKCKYLDLSWFFFNFQDLNGNSPNSTQHHYMLLSLSGTQTILVILLLWENCQLWLFGEIPFSFCVWDTGRMPGTPLIVRDIHLQTPRFILLVLALKDGF